MSREQEAHAALPVKFLAIALIVVSAVGLFYRGLFHLLPLLLSREFRAEGLAGERGLTVLMLGIGWLETFVTLVASRALLRNRGWARAWIVCTSLAFFIPPALFVLRTGDASPLWPFHGAGLSDPFAVILLILGAGPPLLSVTAPALLLLFDRQQLARVPRHTWVSCATAVLLLTGSGWLVSPIGRRDLEQMRIAATPVEVGSGTGMVTLLYDGRPLQAPDGVLAYVTLQDMRTKQQTQTTVPFANGSITLPSLATGSYAFNVVLDANKRNGLSRRRGPMAGDYEGHSGRIALLRNGEVATGEVKMTGMLRLLRPDDTETGIAREDCARVAAPVEFEWEPVPRALGYRCFVSRRWKEGDRWQSEYAKSSYGPATKCRMDLPRNTGESLYEINIEAEGETGVITRFEDPRHTLAEYCFVVE